MVSHGHTSISSADKADKIWVVVVGGFSASVGDRDRDRDRATCGLRKCVSSCSLRSGRTDSVGRLRMWTWARERA